MNFFTLMDNVAVFDGGVYIGNFTVVYLYAALLDKKPRLAV